MKILSVRKGFQADHSSTSYEFFAVDKTLSAADRKAVGKLSSRANPTKRRVSFSYNGDWNDLPGGWGPLVKKHYDVMYSESYDWWTLVIAFNTGQKTIEEIILYEFTDENDLGVSVESEGDRVIITIYCRLSVDMMYLNGRSIDDYGDAEYDITESKDGLLKLLAQNRKYLKNRDYRLLFGVWKKYGFASKDDEGLEDDMPPEPSGMDKLPAPTKRLLSFLDRV